MTKKEIRDYILDLYYSSSDIKGTIESCFNKEFSSTNQTYVYRSVLFTGLPFADAETIRYNQSTDIISKESEYANVNDRYPEQEEIFSEWVFDFWQDITVDHKANLIDGNLRVAFSVFSVWEDYFNYLILQSLVWILLAIICVLIVVTIHTRSFFLSSLAVFQILASFPFAYFIYRFVFQISHFDTLSLFIIFILLGIGADDVFVMTDAFRQSPAFVFDPSSLQQRMTFSCMYQSRKIMYFIHLHQ